VLKRHGLKVDVEYDNGERETVLAENVSPLDVPVEFGGETVPFQVCHACMPAIPLPAKQHLCCNQPGRLGGQHAAMVSHSLCWLVSPVLDAHVACETFALPSTSFRLQVAQSVHCYVFWLYMASIVTTCELYHLTGGRVRGGVQQQQDGPRGLGGPRGGGHQEGGHRGVPLP